MKKLIIILLSIPFFTLAAIEGDPLDLGNVVIQGEIESLEDTLSSIRNLEEYCLISSTEQFEYSAYYSPIIIETSATYPIQERIAFQFKGGLDNFTAVRGVIAKSNIWNFSTRVYNQEIVENWKESIYSLQWQPEINKHKMIFDITSREYNNDIGETSIISGLISYKKSDLVIPQLPKFNWDVDLQTSYHEFAQLHQSTQGKDSKNDFDVNTTLGIKYDNYNGSINVNLLMQQVSGFCDVGISGFKFLDEIKIWCAYDENGLYPSINFNSKIHLFKNLAVRFENNPTISEFSRADGFNDNLLQNIIPGNFQTKKIVNSYITIESDFVLPVSIYYNTDLDKDHIMYDVSDENGFYEFNNIDCLLHKVGLKAVYKLKDLTIFESVEYNISEEQLYFEPLLISSTKLEYDKNVYRIGIDLQLFSGGVDDSNKDMDSGFLMDVSALYKLRDNVSILAEAKNILDQKYEKYTNYTAEELQIIFGVKMTF